MPNGRRFPAANAAERHALASRSTTTSRPRRRAASAASLRRRRSDSSASAFTVIAPTLVAALTKETAEFVRPALIRALAAHGSNPAVAAALTREVSRGEDFFRSVVIEALGDYKITRFFEEWRDDHWNQESLNVKGDLGFAELSMTASYFDRTIKYEWDNANYSQWRSAYYGYFGSYYHPNGLFNVYNTGTAIGTEFNDQ